VIDPLQNLLVDQFAYEFADGFFLEAEFQGQSCKGEGFEAFPVSDKVILYGHILKFPDNAEQVRFGSVSVVHAGPDVELRQFVVAVVPVAGFEVLTGSEDQVTVVEGFLDKVLNNK
jgi:hypothetical protein